MYINHVHARHHSPSFAFVPEEAKPIAAAAMPRRVESLTGALERAQRYGGSGRPEVEYRRT